MQVQTVEEIGGFLQISDKLKNNYFHYSLDSGANLTRIEVPDGNYTEAGLQTQLHSLLNTFSIVNKKLKFEKGGTTIFYFNRLWNGDDDVLPNIRQKLGWIMGHTEDTLTVTGSHIFKNNIQLSNVSYASLVVDDFQNNFYQTVINGTNSYVQNSNILSRIGNINSTKHTQNDNPERKYFGPVDLQKLKIQLVDEFGRTVDLNGNELSFSILLKTQYDM
jgi:hypothetical protein